MRDGLAKRADPSRAGGMQRYMKSDMPYRGVTTPVLRELCSSIFPHYPMATFEEWQRTIIALWDRAEYREERYAALALVGDRHYAPFRTLEALGLYQRLIVGGAWWDLVDGLATHEVGALLRGYPEVMREQLLTCARSVRRLVLIVGLLRHRRSSDQQHRENPFHHARDDMRTSQALHAPIG